MVLLWHVDYFVKHRWTGFIPESGATVIILISIIDYTGPT